MFVKRIQAIFSKVMDSDVGKSGSLVYGTILKMDTSEGVDSKFHKILKKHVEMHLVFTKYPPPKKGVLEKAGAKAKKGQVQSAQVRHSEPRGTSQSYLVSNALKTTLFTTRFARHRALSACPGQRRAPLRRMTMSHP